MKLKKIFVMIVVVCIFMLVNMLICNAKDANDLSYTPTEYTLYSNGNLVDIDTELYNVEGIIYGPLRAVSEAMNLTVDWNSDTSTAIFSNGSHSLSMQLYNYTAYFDGTEVILNTPMCLISDRTMIPIETIAKYFDYEYFLDKANKICALKTVNTATINAIANTGGSIFPSGEITIRSNETITVNILPNYGYVVKDVIIDGKSVGAVKKYTFSDINADTYINVEFSKVNVTLDDNNLKISSEAALNNLKLIIATYNTNCSLYSCNIMDVSSEAGAEYQKIITVDDNTKIMLWDELDNMRPIWCSK